MHKQKSQFDSPSESCPINRKGSDPLPGFTPPSNSALFPGDNSGLMDREKEFEFPIGNGKFNK